MAAILRGAAGLIGRAAPKLASAAGKIGGLIGRTAARTPTIVRQGGKIAAGGAVFEAGSQVARRVMGQGGGDIFGLPVVTDAIEVEALRAPRGYVLVQNPESDDPLDKIAVLKQVAYALGLRKRPSRGGISAREIRAARRVQNVVMSLTVARKPKIKLRKRGGR